MVLESLAPTMAEDLLMALRYNYYVKARPLVSDAIYDIAEREYLTRETTDTFGTPLNTVGSSNPDSYPDRVKALALYVHMAVAEDLNPSCQNRGKK